ncbi:hypothetical protein LMH87_011879 [Akanthomyces muscarius]|uniref:Chloramphenicol acetyltransferase-like domain protein n=1 Tax=Akanthomyces muscarius TaxID=2231603 RepID=A0A9W8QAU6_AKAMU|nr:hypothetical protein LMH87_011879 [Akanthomyces muscarius]KAJ4151164.1 hypothetical protein LMH87_011879 [Akanthomyces muscarius]
MSSGADDDDVYPTGRIDNALTLKPMILSITLRFNDVLDASRLHAALCTLLSTGNWRRLGGRLRKPLASSPSQTLEVHVPRAFTASRPPVAFSHEDLSDTPVAQHPLGKDLPDVDGTATATAGLFHPGEHFRDFAAAPAFPDTIDGFVDRDVPVVSLRVTNFQDATLVAVGVPHLLFDAMALGELLRAWSLVLAGRQDEVPPVVGARSDILYDAADPARRQPGEEPWVLRDVYLVGFSFLLFVMRFLWGVLTERTIEGRVVFMPKHVLAKLRASALADIADGPSATASWVSEGDVLFAWVSRVVSLGQGRWPRPLNGINAVNLRGRLPETTAPSGAGGAVYAGNFVTSSFMPVSVAEARGPLGLVAAKYRAALTAQMTPQQALWTLRASRTAVDKGQDASVVCGAPPTGELFSMTNWLKADIAGSAEFAPAVLLPAGREDGQGGGGNVSKQQKKHVPGRIVYVHAQLHAQSATIRNTLGVVGKDQDGNVWMQGFFPPRTWDVVRKELDELNEKYAE